MRTFIQPQKRPVDEKIEIRIETGIAATLRDYAEFLDSPPGYVVTEILRKAFRKDRAFAEWKSNRDAVAPSIAARGKAARKRTVEEPVATAAIS